MEISGENECFVCGNNIRWQAHIGEPGMTARRVDSTRTQAEAVAIGKVTTTQGRKVQYEIIVECPRCKNKNKYNK